MCKTVFWLNMRYLITNEAEHLLFRHSGFLFCGKYYACSLPVFLLGFSLTDYSTRLFLQILNVQMLEITQSYLLILVLISFIEWTSLIFSLIVCVFQVLLFCQFYSFTIQVFNFNWNYFWIQYEIRIQLFLQIVIKGKGLTKPLLSLSMGKLSWVYFFFSTIFLGKSAGFR